MTCSFTLITLSAVLAREVLHIQQPHTTLLTQGIFTPSLKSIQNEDVPQMEFMYLAFARMPGESQCRRLWSLLLCLCDIFQMLINSLVCWVIEMGPAGWVPDRDTALTLTQRHIDPQILNSKGLFMIVWMFTMHPRCLDVIRSVFILYFWGPWHQLQWIGPLRICWDNVLQ